MQNEDFKPFSELLDAAYDLLGKTPSARVISAGSKALFFNAVKCYSLEQVISALSAHCQSGTFTPVPNDVKTHIEKNAAIAWVSPDEAWAQAPKLESDAGILNQVTAAALAVAQPLIDNGDMIGARMAFIKAYGDRVERAKTDPDPAQRVPVSWVSGGNNPERYQDTHGERQMLLERAVRQGLLPAPSMTPEPLRLETTKRAAGAKPDLKALLASLQPKALPAPEPEDYHVQ